MRVAVPLRVVQSTVAGVATAGCIGIAAYAVITYGVFPLGALVHPQMKLAFQAHNIAIYTHIFASALALVLVPLQLAAGWRRKHPAWHRRIGQVYLAAGVLPGGLSGLYVAQFAFGGSLSTGGFSLLALLWLGTAALAYRAIRRGDVPAHRRWMLRNVALTFAAVTLRLYLGLFFAARVPFELFYPWVSWLCWVPNLLVMTAYLARRPAVH